MNDERLKDMQWVLVEVEPGAMAVWPADSPQGKAAVSGPNRSEIVVPLFTREEREAALAAVPQEDEGLRERGIITTAELLYDNRVGWGEGRAPTAGRAFWAALGMALGRDIGWLIETDPDPENAEAERQAALLMLDEVT